MNVCLTKERQSRRTANVFGFVCAALKGINEPRDIVFPERGIAPPRTHNGHN